MTFMRGRKVDARSTNARPLNSRSVTSVNSKSIRSIGQRQISNASAVWLTSKYPIIRSFQRLPNEIADCLLGVN